MFFCRKKPSANRADRKQASDPPRTNVSVGVFCITYRQQNIVDGLRVGLEVAAALVAVDGVHGEAQLEAPVEGLGLLHRELELVRPEPDVERRPAG